MMNKTTFKHFLEEKRIDLIGETTQYLNDLEDFFATIKGTNDGQYKNETVIRLFDKYIDHNNEEKQMIYETGVKNTSYKKLHDIFTKTAGVGNIYFSINSFSTRLKDRNLDYYKTAKYTRLSNTKEHLATLNCIVMDIDLKDNPSLECLSFDSIVSIFKQIKEPTFVIFSGNGYHIYYNLENIEINYYNRNNFEQIVESYQTCCKSIAKKFKMNNINVDPSVVGDVSRILRIPYSYNAKDIYNLKLATIIYKNTDAISKLSELVAKCNRFNKHLEDNNVIEIKTPEITDGLRKIEFGELESADLLPSDTYPIRNTSYTNFSLFLRNVITDIKFLVKHKDYEGRRYAILFHLATVIEKHNFYCSSNSSWFPIDKAQVINDINEYFNLSKREINNILKSNSMCSTSKEYLHDLLGVNQIDETYMRAIFISEEEVERRKQLQKERKTKNCKKYNDINNAKRSELSKSKKQEKIEYENNLVKPLLNNHSLREISKLTGFSLGKIQTIVKRING